MSSNQKVAVLGAGIIGLSTALEFQRRFPTCDITILADKFDVDTTSDGAAGLFEPSPSFMGPDLETTKEWIKFSFGHYESLLGEDCGIKVLTGYSLAKHTKACGENHYLKPVLPVYKPMSEEELAEISPGDWKYGTYMSTLVIPNRLFLPWCMKRFKSAGGKVIQKRIEDFSELGSNYDVVFNCTGLGAGVLCDDIHVIPVRGQVIRIQNSAIDKFYKDEYATYIIPNGFDGQVTLGGTQNFGHTNRFVDEIDTESILNRTKEILPELADYKGKKEIWVGLRPHRYQVRVETESRPNLKIIHNYGHGGYGVTSAPGSARSAVNLFETMHKSTVAHCIRP